MHGSANYSRRPQHRKQTLVLPHLQTLSHGLDLKELSNTWEMLFQRPRWEIKVQYSQTVYPQVLSITLPLLPLRTLKTSLKNLSSRNSNNPKCQLEILSLEILRDLRLQYRMQKLIRFSAVECS